MLMPKTYKKYIKWILVLIILFLLFLFLYFFYGSEKRRAALFRAQQNFIHPFKKKEDVESKDTEKKEDTEEKEESKEKEEEKGEEAKEDTLKEETVSVKGSDVKIKFTVPQHGVYQKKQNIRVQISGKAKGDFKYQWSSGKTPSTFPSTISNNQTVSIGSATGTFYLWISFDDKDGKNHVVKSPPVLLDNAAPTISFAQKSNLYYSRTENEGTVVYTNDRGGGIQSSSYVWSRSRTQVPNDFPNSFISGQRISKTANSKAFYLWIKSCDRANNCSVSVSEPFVGTLIHPSTVNNNRPRLTTCGKFDGNEIALFHYVLESRVNSASTKRGRVAAAAKFLAMEFPYRIAYYMNDVIATYPTRGHYYQKGLFLNSSNGWGCSVRKEKSFPSLSFSAGSYYPNGLDCSGFVTWAFYNGGVFIGDHYTSAFSSLGVPIAIPSSYSSQMKIGDILWKDGHAGLVIEKNANQILIAEEKGNANNGGIFVTSYRSYEEFKANTNFTHIISMDSVYGG